jgi:hypothetical protein
MPDGTGPTGYVPTTAPVEGSSLITVLPVSFVTQVWVPSKATPEGIDPGRGNVTD